MVADEFVAVRPRVRAVPRSDEDAPQWKRSLREEDGDQEEKGAEPSDAFEPTPDSGMSLLFLTKRLLTEPKITCNTRIVVVGASTAGVSFIETLLYTPYLNFTNVTLVSPGGLGLTDEAYSVLPNDDDFPSPGRLAALGLHHRIRVADSTMTELDRDAKAIVLEDGSVLPYDVLVLASGRADASAARIKGAGDNIDGVFFLTKAGSKAVLPATEYLEKDDQVRALLPSPTRANSRAQRRPNGGGAPIPTFISFFNGSRAQRRPSGGGAPTPTFSFFQGSRAQRRPSGGGPSFMLASLAPPPP